MWTDLADVDESHFTPTGTKERMGEDGICAVLKGDSYRYGIEVQVQTENYGFDDRVRLFRHISNPLYGLTASPLFKEPAVKPALYTITTESALSSRSQAVNAGLKLTRLRRNRRSKSDPPRHSIH